MEWKTFSRDIQEREYMMFWDKQYDNWLQGYLRDHSEYGLIISVGEYYMTVDNISHYMIPEKPLK